MPMSKGKKKISKTVNNLIKKIFKLRKKESRILKRNCYRIKCRILPNLSNRWKIHQWKCKNSLKLSSNHLLTKYLKHQANFCLIMHAHNVNNGQDLQMIVFWSIKIQPWVLNRVISETVTWLVLSVSWTLKLLKKS